MPDKSRRRKNNKNKRKNRNKSERSPVNVSVSDSENKVDDVSSKVVECDVTPDAGLENSAKVSSDLDVISTNGDPTSLPLDLSIASEVDEVDSSCCNKTTAEDVQNISNISDVVVSDANSDSTNINDQKESDVPIVNKCDESLTEYVVESPDRKSANTPKLNSNVKSKSVDNDDSPTITEVTEEVPPDGEIDSGLSVIESKNVIITDADSDIEWQKTDDLKESDINITNDVKVSPVSNILSLNTAQCDKANILETEDERSLRNFLQTLNLSTNPEDANSLEIKAEIEHIINREIKHRLRKRETADDFIFQKGPARSLTVIDEEGSSESSMTSRRQSHLSEKASDTDELEDDVFESKAKDCKDQRQIRPAHRSYPIYKTIPQECFRVDAKLKEPEITEARGGWAMKTTETLTGAELVYLTDSSSSTSSVYDLNDDKENSEDTDASVRIITPTIEVTDTEKLLNNSCLVKDDKSKVLNNNNNVYDNCENIFNNSNDKLLQKEKHTDPHEIVIDSIENIKTDLYVKEISDNSSASALKNGVTENNQTMTTENCAKVVNKYDLEMKVIKCELNDAINNLIKEVASDSECVQSDNNLLQRQDSSSSLGSSQCTAKYNPNHSSLNDVADIISDTHNETFSQTTHVKEVYDRAVADKKEFDKSLFLKPAKQPETLKKVCLQKITSLPYGNKILEELANVSECLQTMSLQNAEFSKESKKMLETSHYASNKTKERHSIPPPIQPRTSSFKITKDELKPELLSSPGRGIRCVSPSNKMLMEKTNTVIRADKPQFSLPTLNKLNNIDDGFINKDDSKKYQMKSETGSRLMSLLRDTSGKSNSNPFLYKSSTNENLEKLSKIGFSQNFRSQFKNNLSRFDPHEKYMSDSESYRSVASPKLRSFSSSFYESDDSSDLTENTLRKMHNERRYFHYSTGNLSKDIENDVSSIQNMHRHYMNVRDKGEEARPRRPSLPKDLCEKQMEYIRQKEKEVDAELQRLERENTSNKHKRSPRAPMISEESFERRTLSSSYTKPYIKEIHSNRTERRQMSSIFNSSEEELRRERMYSEYVSQMAEREKRREHKVIKITKPSATEAARISRSTTALDSADHRLNNPIEGEFITKARERWDKLGIRDPETEDERDLNSDVYKEPKVVEHKIKVIDAGEEKDVKRLPNHLQEFVSFTVKETDRRSPGECEPEKPAAHVLVLCVMILMMAVGRLLMRLIRRV